MFRLFSMRAKSSLPGLLLAVTLVLAAWPGRAEEPATNLIEDLQARLDSGSAKLDFAADGHSYLRSLLGALQVPTDSQLLVFSQSSLQFDRIGPKTPRAIYYQDNVAVGSVQNGRVIEMIAADRKDGIAFYTLDVGKTDKPRFVRETGECMICHGFASRWASGMLVANMDTGPDGTLQNLDPANMFRLTDDRTPFANRYGGWYVTGITGDMHHRGNVTIDPANPVDIPPGGLNITDLSDKLDTRRYLSSGSDIVSLLTLEHQTGFVNLITRINAQMHGLNNDAVIADLRATQADVDSSIAELVAYMTFVDEVPLPSPVSGTSTFAQSFPKRSPHDAQGRSLRDFDLQTRLFRYPLSYMVYSRNFADLNPVAKAQVWRRLYDVLRGADTAPLYKGLELRGGKAAIEILAAQPPAGGVPPYWK